MNRELFCRGLTDPFLSDHADRDTKESKGNGADCKSPSNFNLGWHNIQVLKMKIETFPNSSSKLIRASRSDIRLRISNVRTCDNDTSS